MPIVDFYNNVFETVRNVIVNEKTKSAEMDLVTICLFDILCCSNVYYLLPFIEPTNLKLVAELQLFLVLAFTLGSPRKILLKLVVYILKELFLLCLSHEENVRKLRIAVAELFLQLER